jgi:ATP-binding cassette subfamily B protein
MNAVATATGPGDTRIGNAVDPAPHPDRARHWLRRIAPLLRPHRGLAALAVLFAIATVVFQTAIPTLLGRSIDALAEAIRTRDIAPLQYALWLLLIGGVARSAVSFAVRSLLFKLTLRIESSLRRQIYRRLIALPLPFFARMPTGQLLSRVNNDVRTIQNFLLYLPYTAMVFGAFFFSVAYMFAIDVRLALLAVVPLPLVMLLSQRLRRLAYPLSWLIQSRMADVASVVDENIRGQSVVKLFNRQQQQKDEVMRTAAGLRWASLAMIRHRARYSPWIENLAVLGQIAILLYGGALVIRGELQLGQLVTFNMYVLMMLTPFSTLGRVLVMARSASAAAVRVFAILDEPLPAEVEETATASPTVHGGITFERVRYAAPEDPERPGSGGRIVLDGLDADIAAGRITAIVGKTGSGKTAMAHLLAGLAAPESGRILIDGIGIDRIPPSRLHRELILVAQDGFLFADSIAANIAFGAPQSGQNDIERAARIAQAHQFIEEQPQGYATQVGEGGGTLSGGQRQRIAIAQAVLMRPSVLVLDDATSALDSVTEARVIESLKREMRGRTMIVISHRASMVRHADEVLLLHEGRIVDRGTHESLSVSQPLYGEVFAQDIQEVRIEGESDVDFRKRIDEAVRGAANFDVGLGDAI